MTEQQKSGLHCSDFEAVLLEAVDGTLAAGTLAQFQTHAETCVACRTLFAEAQTGHNWLLELEEVEPPKNLVHNILARTTGVAAKHATSAETRLPWSERLFGWIRSAGTATWGAVRQPRFAMSTGMALFSVSMALNVAGIRVTDLAKADLRPSAIKRSYYETQGRVVKYYRNIRFVYEIESRVRDLQRATQSEEREREPQRKKNDKSETTRKPERERQQNYFSQDESKFQLADRPAAPRIGMLKSRSEA